MELNKSIFKFLTISNIILMLLLFGTNIAWFVYESQFETVTETTEQIIENVQTVRDITQNT